MQTIISMIEKFWHYTNSLDKLRKESLKDVCPVTFDLLKGNEYGPVMTLLAKHLEADYYRFRGEIKLCCSTYEYVSHISKAG